ncbi:hypothetical protein TNCV_4903251 [Trichonephila clavipes]|nr:hypothetical protein TNCV_4903251 [Trichonephila clavipes]
MVRYSCGTKQSIGRTGPCLEEPMVLGTVSEGTECETILFPMRNRRDLEGCEGVLCSRGKEKRSAENERRRAMAESDKKTG